MWIYSKSLLDIQEGDVEKGNILIFGPFLHFTVIWRECALRG